MGCRPVLTRCQPHARRAARLLGSEFDVTRIYDLGPFQLDVANQTLTMSGAPVALGLHAVAVLINLVERAPQLAPKASIIDAVWPDVVVEESNLPVQIHALRHALAQV